MLHSLPDEVLNNPDHFDFDKGDIRPNEKATEEEIKAWEDFKKKIGRKGNLMLKIIE